jgi:hypothetical protein
MLQVYLLLVAVTIAVAADTSSHQERGGTVVIERQWG